MIIMMMMKMSLTSLFLILGIFCSSSWASFQRRSECSPPYLVPCKDGRGCYSSWDLCNGFSRCEDDTDETPQYCKVLAQVRRCEMAIQLCSLHVTMPYIGLNEFEILDRVRSDDLRVTCGPVLEAQQCVAEALRLPECQFSLPPELPKRQKDKLKLMVTVLNTTVTFVCRDHVDEFSEYKDCLLRPGPDYPVPELAMTTGRRCRRRYVRAISNTVCPLPSIECIEEVVSEQCGEETGSLIGELGVKILDAIDCTKRKRSTVMKKGMFSSLEMMQESFLSLF